jgi:hypothetical protein
MIEAASAKPDKTVGQLKIKDTNQVQSCIPPVLSTPFAVTSVESANAPNSAAFPLITADCHAFSSSELGVNPMIYVLFASHYHWQCSFGMRSRRLRQDRKRSVCDEGSHSDL